MPRLGLGSNREERCHPPDLRKSNKQICQRTFSISRVQKANHAVFALCRGEKTTITKKRTRVCAVFLLPRCLVFFFASGSEGRAKAERRQNEGTLGRREPKSRSPLRHRNNSQDCCFTSRPFSNAKIVRNNDMANFFKQKMSLFPLLEKRGSLRGQKRLSFATGKEVPRVTKRGFSQLSWANCGLLARGTLVHNSKVCKLRNIIRFPRCFFFKNFFPIIGNNGEFYSELTYKK